MTASTTSTSTSAADLEAEGWFFASYRLNDQYKYTLGATSLRDPKLTNPTL